MSRLRVGLIGLIATALLSAPLFGDLSTQTLRGRALIQSNGKFEVVVFVDASAEHTGTAGHVFVLASDTEFDAPLADEIEDAMVTVTPTSVTISPWGRPQGYVLAASLDGSEPTLPRRSNVTLLLGGALSHHWGDLGLRLDAVRRTASEAHSRPLELLGRFGPYVERERPRVISDGIYSPDPIGSGGGNGTNCDSGGKPATQCSATKGSLSCSVSCPAGQYACCKYGGTLGDPSCKCYPN